MLITSLELFGYKRFALNMISKLVIKPTEKIQLILGTNGSGKSSLIKELTPLPANSADYAKEGHKIIHISAHGNDYVLSSFFSPSQRHSFIKNDEELNSGGTASVQRELVKKEFNITPDVHELLTGAIIFNTMGPGERRSWFTRLSDTNFTYAISVFQKLKEKHRDVLGAIKLNQARAVQEAQKLTTPEQESELKNEILELKNFLLDCLTKKSPNQIIVSDVRRKLQQTALSLENLSKNMLKVRHSLNQFEDFNSISNLTEEIIRETIFRTHCQETINGTIKKIEELELTIRVASETNVTEISEVDGKIAEINTAISNLDRQLENAINFQSPLLAYQALDAVTNILSDIASTIPENSEKKFSRNSYEINLTSKQEQENILRSRETILDSLYAKKKLMEEQKNQEDIECPKCTFRWKPGFNETHYNQLLKDIETAETIKSSAESAVKRLEAFLTEIKEYMTIYRSYSDTVRSWPILQPLWDHIQQSEIIFNNPRGLIYLLDRTKSALKLMIERESRFEDLKNLQDLKAIVEKNGQESFANFKSRLLDHNKTLHDLNVSVSKSTQRIENLTFFKESILSIQNTEKVLSELTTEYESLSKSMVTSLYDEMLDKIIQATQLEMSKKSQQLSKVDLQRGVVEGINTQIRELEEEAEVLKVMVRELSPSEGIIAKGLMGFINAFVKQMNSFIRKVWLYPMEIIPIIPDPDEGVDLDYKFSVLINNQTPIPDIKLLSSAQAEIINLAFRIVAIKYMGLSEASLCLDEFAARMDHAHRASAFHVISNLITQSNFQQIFIVSHFENCYGSLRNAEVLVLCDKNIVLPKGAAYNQHVEIK